MDAGFEARHLYAACRLTFTHNYSPGNSPGTTFGTGFVVGFPEGDSRFGLVTNRHLVDAAWAEPQCIGTALESIKVEMWQSINLKLTFEISDPKPVYHDDESIDVAVIPFGPAFDTRTTLGTVYDKIENLIPDPNVDSLVFTHAMSWEHLLKCEQLWQQLRPGEFVLFPGYPIWYDKSQTRPVFRSGVLASDPHTDLPSSTIGSWPRCYQHSWLRLHDRRLAKIPRGAPPRWGKPAKRPDAEAGDSLAVGLIWESGGRSGISESWSDSPAKRTRVESLLRRILWEIERRSDHADRRREKERLAAIERERLQAEAERCALVLHTENVRAEALRDQHARWREGSQLREYIAAMDRAIERLPDDDDRAAASEWRAWCQQYIDSVLDPLSQPLAMPEIREWTRDERHALEKRILRQLDLASRS